MAQGPNEARATCPCHEDSDAGRAHRLAERLAHFTRTTECAPAPPPKRQRVVENVKKAPDVDAIDRESRKFDQQAPSAVEHCSTCENRWFDLRTTTTAAQLRECRRCAKDPYKRFGRDHHMGPADPKDHPELQGLSALEELLISPIVPVASIYRLAQGQYGYRNHVLSFPMDVQRTVDQLPRDPRKLPLLIVCAPGQEATDREFLVRCDRVFDALQHLKTIKHPVFDVNRTSQWIRAGSTLSLVAGVGSSPGRSEPVRALSAMMIGRRGKGGRAQRASK